jgi:hypothetical protein
MIFPFSFSRLGLRMAVFSYDPPGWHGPSRASPPDPRGSLRSGFRISSTTSGVIAAATAATAAADAASHAAAADCALCMSGLPDRGLEIEVWICQDNNNTQRTCTSYNFPHWKGRFYSLFVDTVFVRSEPPPRSPLPHPRLSPLCVLLSV